MAPGMREITFVLNRAASSCDTLLNARLMAYVLCQREYQREIPLNRRIKLIILQSKPNKKKTLQFCSGTRTEF